MPQNKAFCSICTLNYSAHAATLNDSLKKVGHTEPHYVLIIDQNKIYHNILSKFKFTPIYLNQLKIPRINKFIKKYNAFELSNILKPFFMEWLLNNHPKIKYLIYLDTDVYVYSPLIEIFKIFDTKPTCSLIITPHILDVNDLYDTKDYSIETKYFKAGLYNGGFYAIKNDHKAREFLKWHQYELANYGYSAKNAHMFVDQKILDLAPLIFDFVFLFKNPTYNVAYWRHPHRTLSLKHNQYYVNNQRIVFFHFSKLRLINQGFQQNYLCQLPLKNHRLLLKMCQNYWQNILKNNFDFFNQIPYGHTKNYQPPPLSLIDPIAYRDNIITDLSRQVNQTHSSPNHPPHSKIHHLIQHLNHLRLRAINLINKNTSLKSFIKRL